MFLASCMNLTEGLDEADALVVSVNTIEMDCNGGESSIEVDAFCSWKISSTEEWSWITSTVNKGDKGNSKFKLILSENETVEDRTATITIENKTYEIVREISVLQTAGSPFIKFSKNLIDATSAGHRESIVIESNVDYTIASSAEWCGLSELKGESGKTTLNIEIASSPTTAERTATITFKNAQKGYSAELTVTQSSFKPSLEVSESKIDATDLGLEKEFTVTSNIPWSITCEANWVNLSSVNGDMGTSTIVATIQKNSGTEGREAKILVTNSEYEIVKEIDIKQMPIVPTIEVSESNIASTEEGRTVNFTVTSNINWTVKCDADWVIITPANGMKGTNTVQVSVDRNATTERREAVILVSNAEYKITKEIAVSQFAFGPGLEVSETQIAATNESMTKDITVTSNIAWSASCEANWVTLSSVNGDGGNKTITVSLHRNATTSARETTILIKNSEYDLTREVVITQEAFVPELTVSDTQINATVAGMTKNMTITANIDWNAVCEANWVTLSAVNGTGSNRAFTVTVARNATTSARSTTITVSNAEYGISHEIAVSQEAFAPRFELSSQELSFSSFSETKSISIDANVAWTTTCNADWLTLSPVNGTGANGMTTMSITSTANLSTSAREATIVIYSSEYNLTGEIAVSQEGFTPELAIVGENELTLDYMSGTRNIAVRANVAYTATTDADWMYIEQTTEGIRLTYSTNLESSESRTATVSINTSEYDDMECILTVTQAGYSELNTISYTSTGGLIMPNVNSGFGANIVAVSYEGGQGYIRFDEPVRFIPENAFSNCTGLTSISLPDGVLAIYSNAFTGCSALENITLNDCLTHIGNNAFKNCSSLEEIELPSSVETIGESSFYGCSLIESIEIPSGVETIGRYTFYNCSALEEFNIPSSVTSIGEYAFYGCSSIESVSIPSSITTIGSYAFGACSELTEVEIEGNETSIGSYVFSSCDKLETVEITGTVSSLGNYAFQNCTSLASATLPAGLTAIGAYTFYGCSALESIDIPSEVTSIGTYAFANCSSIETVMIPAKVSSIGAYAFYNCTSLKTVISMRTTPATGANSMFNNNASSRKIYVPTGYSNTYKNASYWDSYATFIYDLEYTPTECTSLSITAEDVEADETTTIISYTAITNGTTPYGSLSGVEMTGRVQSASFAANETEEDVEVEISFTYMGVTATTTIVQKGISTGSYTIRLNNAWRMSSSVSNPNSELYDGVYESYSNYNKNSTTATMYIDIEGYETFELYIRSYAESSFDYVTVSNLDNSSSTKASTSNNQNSGTSLSNYTKVTYSGIDKGKHTITVKYIKDGSVNSGTDRGYILIPKNQ